MQAIEGGTEFTRRLDQKVAFAWSKGPHETPLPNGIKGCVNEPLYILYL